MLGSGLCLLFTATYRNLLCQFSHMYVTQKQQVGQMPRETRSVWDLSAHSLICLPLSPSAQIFHLPITPPWPPPPPLPPFLSCLLQCKDRVGKDPQRQAAEKEDLTQSLPRETDKQMNRVRGSGEYGMWDCSFTHLSRSNWASFRNDSWRMRSSKRPGTEQQTQITLLMLQHLQQDWYVTVQRLKPSEKVLKAVGLWQQLLCQHSQPHNCKNKFASLLQQELTLTRLQVGRVQKRGDIPFDTGITKREKATVWSRLLEVCAKYRKVTEKQC